MTCADSEQTRLKTMRAALMYTSGKLEVNGVELAYVKVGTGSCVVLLLPGALGSGVTDFGPQLKGMDRNQFTVIAWDPRGYGRSIPPERDFPTDFLHRDADDAAALMKKFGFSKYSVVGWSDGGNTACILAARHPDKVEKLVEWGGGAYITKKELDDFENVSDVSAWSPKMRQPMVDMYGEEYFQKTWTAWNAGYRKILEECEGDIMIDELKNIKAPTLIIHGMKDFMTPAFHAEFLHENIKNSVVEYWEDAKHNLHLRYPEKFNALVEKFLLKLD